MYEINTWGVITLYLVSVFMDAIFTVESSLMTAAVSTAYYNSSGRVQEVVGKTLVKVMLGPSTCHSLWLRIHVMNKPNIPVCQRFRPHRLKKLRGSVQLPAILPLSDRHYISQWGEEEKKKIRKRNILKSVKVAASLNAYVSLVQEKTVM